MLLKIYFRAMAAEAEANREAKAKVKNNHIYCFVQIIAAQGEKEASLALSEAATTMAESPGALQLRYLQTLNTIR